MPWTDWKKKTKKKPMKNYSRRKHRLQMEAHLVEGHPTFKFWLIGTQRKWPNQSWHRGPLSFNQNKSSGKTHLNTESIKGLFGANTTIFSFLGPGVHVSVLSPSLQQETWAAQMTLCDTWNTELCLPVLESVPECHYSPAIYPWWDLSLLKFAMVSQEGCDHRPWTLSYWRADWGRKNKLLAICTSYIGNCPFHSFVLLFIGLLILWEFSFLSPLYILVINPLSDV
jgi:hypothetical protein